jgi:tripartite-type tricarboxylate transporter receptor subunit TctC
MKRVNLFGFLTLILSGILTIFLFTNFAIAVYPEKSVTLICVWGAGGANDSIARKLAETMKKYFPEPVVVVNRPGGAGTVGTAEIVAAKPDGYTIGTTTMSAITIKPHQMSLPYKTPDDYYPIALVGTQAFTLAVNSELPFKTLKDFIEYAKTNPGKVRVNHGGIGHISHLIFEQLKLQAQVDMLDVPFTGGGEQIAALLGKHTEASVLTLYELYPQLQAGKVRILALSDEKRRSLIPDVPTFKELGYDITMTTYTVLIGPKTLPIDVVSKIQEVYRKVSEDSTFLKFMEAQGFTVHYESTKDLKNRLWTDYNTNKNLFERIGEKKK